MMQSTAHLSDQRGFTLPEVLVALVLTLIMTSAAMTTMLQTSRTARGATALTDINQNLRVSMNVVIRDLLQAGYQIPVGGIPFPTGTGAGMVYRPGPPGSTLVWNSGFPWNAGWVTIPSVAPGPSLGPTINNVNTDIVTVLRLDSALNWEPVPTNRVTIPTGTNGSMITFPGTFPIGDPVNGIKTGDLIMINRVTLLEVTSVSGQNVYFAATSPSNLNQHNAPQGSMLQLKNGAGWIPGCCTAERVLMLTYYLDGSGSTPSLMRKVNYGAERKLAVGIENFQLTWDLVDGVTNPSNVEVPLAPTNTPGQIRKANLHMAARTQEKMGTGSYLRSALNTQVALRSLAFVDRYK